MPSGSPVVQVIVLLCLLCYLESTHVQVRVINRGLAIEVNQSLVFDNGYRSQREALKVVFA